MILSQMITIDMRDMISDDLSDVFKKNLLSDGSMKGGGALDSKKQYYLSQDMDMVYR